MGNIKESDGLLPSKIKIVPALLKYFRMEG
jgi:hypothetical protein